MVASRETAINNPNIVQRISEVEILLIREARNYMYIIL